MKSLGLKTIPLADIDISNRLRAIDEGHAQLLAENIQETGKLRQPVEVRVLQGGKYRLIAGGHRLRAVELLGWSEIEAFVFETDNDDEAKLAEIDENLVRHDLNPLDRAVFLAERKAVYERLHPETKHGAQGGRSGQRNENDTMSFSKDTAERCGIPDRTIQRAVKIFKGLPPDIRARIAGTWIAKKQSELLALVKVAPSLRGDVIDLLLEDASPLTSVKGALRVLEGGNAAPAGDDQQKKVAALRKAWDRAGKTARRAWLFELNDDDRIDEIRDLLAEMAGEKPAAVKKPPPPRVDQLSEALVVPTPIRRPTREQVIREAESDGYTAYQHGVSRNENPYIDRDEDLADAWARGWEQAAAEDADPADAA
jgi:ParB family transcriptional regulator, chromosome partitioning protein